MLRDEIQNLLQNSAGPLYAHEIVRRQRSLTPRRSSIDIQSEILSMLRDNALVEERKRYSLSISATKPRDLEEGSDKRPSWDSFRALCQYYVSCLRAVEGADAFCKLTDYKQKFISRHLIGLSTPSGTSTWQHPYPLDSDLADFLSNKKQDDSVVLGYPTFVTADSNTVDNERLAIPIFCLKVDLKSVGDRVHLTSSNPVLFINEKFLSVLRFDKDLEHKIEAFRQATGEYDLNVFPTFSLLASILMSFFPKLCHGAVLSPESAGSYGVEQVARGDRIVNSAVLMLTKRPVYSLRRINELEQILREPDESLSQTALSALFGNSEVKAHTVDALIGGSGLSYSQYKAARSILGSTLSAINGPPGAGKSEVVSAIANHCLVSGKSLLLSSYQHKALEAVCARTKIPGNEELSYLRRFNTKDNQDALSLQVIVEELQNRNSDNFETARLQKLIEECRELSIKRNEVLARAESLAKQEGEVNRLEKELAFRLEDFPMGALNEVLKLRSTSLLKVCKALEGRTPGAALIRLLHRIFRGSYVRACRSFCASNRRAVSGDSHEIRRLAGTLRECILLHEKISSIKSGDEDCNVEALSATYDTIVKKLEGGAPELLTERIREPVAESLNLDAIRLAIKDWRRELRDGVYSAKWSTGDTKHLQQLLRHYSCSAATSASVGKFFPLLPGLFDYALLDEAGASDFPSAIPVLFRAKQAAVIGDPQQLSPVIKMREDLDQQFQIEHGINLDWTRRFNYKLRSLFDVCSSAAATDRVMLNENYRSHPTIVSYSNVIAYNDQITSRAFSSNLMYPRGFKPGIEWINIRTSAKAKTENCSKEEADSVLAALSRITDVENGAFEGSVGVISPFRDQAQMIEDRIEKEFSVALREKHKLTSQTVHAFQGAERDCIILSLCGGDFLRTGTSAFLENDRRLFNVAVSRAKATLIVVGDFEWAKNSSIEHIRLLAELSEGSARARRTNEWAPYESPWEKIFAEKLIAIGLKPIPQHPVANRMLDLALIDEARGIRIDVEVDGAAYHRRSDGTRRTEDLWRNYQLRTLGWKVMRYWVYELRGDLDKCANEVKVAFEKGKTK